MYLSIFFLVYQQISEYQIKQKWFQPQVRKCKSYKRLMENASIYS